MPNVNLKKPVKKLFLKLNLKKLIKKRLLKKEKSRKTIPTSSSQANLRTSVEHSADSRPHVSHMYSEDHTTGPVNTNPQPEQQLVVSLPYTFKSLIQTPDATTSDTGGNANTLGDDHSPTEYNDGTLNVSPTGGNEVGRSAVDHSAEDSGTHTLLARPGMSQIQNISAFPRHTTTDLDFIGPQSSSTDVGNPDTAGAGSQTRVSGSSGFVINHANFNANSDISRGYCYPNTRMKIQKDIKAWAMDPTRSSRYWISGMAGTGKSTIAMSLCKELKDEGVLAGSFFCNRQITECRDYRLIIPTLAYQLAKFSELFASGLKVVLDRDFDLANKAPLEQVQNLLIEPWKSAVVDFEGQKHIPVVVLDALDECRDVSLTLEPLVDAIQRNELQGLKFLFTSRPEQEIMAKMNGTASFLQAVLQVERLVLHDVEEVSVQKDITSYLEQELQHIHLAKKDIDSLAKLSGKLFIYAATVAKFISSSRIPPSRIKARLEAAVKPGQILGNLAKLYTDILEDAIYREGDDSQEAEILNQERRESWQIIHTIMALEAPLSCGAIAELLQLSEDVVDHLINILHAVFYIAKETKAVLMFHTSFANFIKSKKQSADFKFPEYDNVKLHTDLKLWKH
ncbi:hypothetical protein D9757_011481 [Collybiopsis confluens]|uniref:Nephrocystin 3-like N-terminal domain-containing protein n=1 Tax=Collybiopsis confluens TaxID=2823264 RepID=A0A8H5GV97_9AGAR|nr:hypothetical protein D9757_011481 [Collybiopsis confluens]